MKVTLAQLNLIACDIQGNSEKIIAAIDKAKQQGSQLIVFPELALCGYPPEDYLFRQDFHQQIKTAIDNIVQHTDNIAAVIGYPDQTSNGIYNSAIVMQNKKVISVYHKQHLPNYSVFDEKRYFTEGDKSCIVTINKIKFGILICEDIWHPEAIAKAKADGAEIIVTLNASPFHYQKAEIRYENLIKRQQETELPILYVNLLGGQDDLVFDGGSFALTKHGDIAVFADFFHEQLLSVNINKDKDFDTQPIAPFPDVETVIYNALVLAVKDYITKNGFNGALLGLSGGIDSALTLAIAVDALGAENVHAVMMPSRYTADISMSDAEAQAKNSKVQYSVLPIERPFSVFNEVLSEEFEGLPPDTTEENIQARCRGILLMALSNKTGKIVLTTGNKSEMSVGYATLYGDMAGGFAVLKDVPKMLVYQLASYRNKLSLVIPQRVIDRPPSAELAPDQLDENTLPPYSILDAILERYVEHDQSISDIVMAGYNRETVERVAKMVKRNEYKRRQAPPGPRITPRSYGRDRRYPITSGFEAWKF